MSTPAGGGSSGSLLGFGSPLDAVNAVSSAVDVLASMQSRMSDPMERVTSRSAGLREMMRRATARSMGVDMSDRAGDAAVAAELASSAAPGGLPIPTLSWPPDPPTFDSSLSGTGSCALLYQAILVILPYNTNKSFSAWLYDFAAMLTRVCKNFVADTRHSFSRQNSSSASTSGLGGATSAPTAAADMMPGMSSSQWSLSPVKLDDRDRRSRALAILKVLCDWHIMEKYLPQLLSAK